MSDALPYAEVIGDPIDHSKSPLIHNFWLNALDIEAGPVATVKLPVRVRSTFHGTWVPEETLRTGLYPYTLAEA